MEFALEFHKRHMASLVCKQICSLTGEHRFLGHDPNTVVKLDQREASVNDKASLFLVYKHIYMMVMHHSNAPVLITSAMSLPVCIVHIVSHK